jgi:hypothetical protein
LASAVERDSYFGGGLAGIQESAKLGFLIGTPRSRRRSQFLPLCLQPDLDFVPELSCLILYIFHASFQSYSYQRPGSLRVKEVEQLLVLFGRPTLIASFASFHGCNHLPFCSGVQLIDGIGQEIAWR